MPTHAYRILRNTDHLIGFDEKPTEKPTEKCLVMKFGFVRFRQTEMDLLFGWKAKNRPSYFSLPVHNTACTMYVIITTAREIGVVRTASSSLCGKCMEAAAKLQLIGLPKLPLDFRLTSESLIRLSKWKLNSASKMKVLDKVKREVLEVEWKSNGSPTEVLELKLK